MSIPVRHDGPGPHCEVSFSPKNFWNNPKAGKNVQSTDFMNSNHHRSNTKPYSLGKLVIKKPPMRRG
jgi:hypothetical protein